MAVLSVTVTVPLASIFTLSMTMSEDEVASSTTSSLPVNVAAVIGAPVALASTVEVCPVPAEVADGSAFVEAESPPPRTSRRLTAAATTSPLAGIPMSSREEDFTC